MSDASITTNGDTMNQALMMEIPDFPTLSQFFGAESSEVESNAKALAFLKQELQRCNKSMAMLKRLSHIQTDILSNNKGAPEAAIKEHNDRGILLGRKTAALQQYIDKLKQATLDFADEDADQDDVSLASATATISRKTTDKEDVDGIRFHPSWPRFKENDRNVEDFLKSFTGALRLTYTRQIFDKPLAGRYLGLSIDSKERLRRYSELFDAEDNTANTWEDATRIFRMVCLNTDHVLDVSKELLQIKLLDNESYKAYAERISRQVESTHTHDDTFAIFTHIWGTLPATGRTLIRQHVMLNHLLSGGTAATMPKLNMISQLVNGLRHLDGPDRADRPASTGKRSAEEAFDNDASEPKPLRCRYCDKLHHIEKDCRKKQRDLKQLQNQENPTSSTAYTSSSRQNNAGRNGGQRPQSSTNASSSTRDSRPAFNSNMAIQQQQHDTLQILRNPNVGYEQNNKTCDVDFLYSLFNSTMFFNSALNKRRPGDDLDNRISVPITYENETYDALLDTGATTTFLDVSVVERHNITMTPAEGMVMLGKSGITAPRVGYVGPLRLTCNGRTLDVKCEVFELPAHAIQIGMDYFHKFGFSIENLPNPAGDHSKSDEVLTIPDVPHALVPLQQPAAELTEEFQSERNRMLEHIAPVLEANASIPPTSHCTIDGMRVFLPVPEGTVLFRKPRPFAESQQKIFDEQIEKWLADGVCNELYAYRLCLQLHTAPAA